MADRQWVTAGLLGAIALLLAALLLSRTAPPAQAQASEGRAQNVIAVAVPYGGANASGGSLLYLVDTAREVVLVYGFHSAGQAPGLDMRNGAFEFLAGRLYRWDLLLSTKREYAMRGVRTLQGLRVFGPGSSELGYQNTEK